MRPLRSSAINREEVFDLKRFVEIFFICLLLCFIGLFFFGGLLLSNIWFVLIFIAFLMAVSISSYIHHDDRIEALEKKLAQLTGEAPPEEATLPEAPDFPTD